jgi:hypothetical protein
MSDVVEDILDNRADLASTYLYVVLVDRLTRDSLGTDLSVRFDEVLEEATIEMVLAMADQAPTMVGRSLTETVERFMTAHVKSLKDDIIMDVVANLVADEPYPEAWSDNDTV